MVCSPVTIPHLAAAVAVFISPFSSQVSSISGSSSEEDEAAKPLRHRSPQTVFVSAGDQRVVVVDVQQAVQEPRIVDAPLQLVNISSRKYTLCSTLLMPAAVRPPAVSLASWICSDTTQVLKRVTESV